jgi:hypothetical protein
MHAYTATYTFNHYTSHSKIWYESKNNGSKPAFPIKVDFKWTHVEGQLHCTYSSKLDGRMTPSFCHYLQLFSDTPYKLNGLESEVSLHTAQSDG